MFGADHNIGAPLVEENMVFEEIMPRMSIIIPTCIGGSCLPDISVMTIFANAVMIALLIGVARRNPGVKAKLECTGSS